LGGSSFKTASEKVTGTFCSEYCAKRASPRGFERWGFQFTDSPIHDFREEREEILVKLVSTVMIVAVLVMATTPSSAPAAVIFISADDETNTARADGSADPWFDINSTTSDNLWRKRDDGGNGLLYSTNDSSSVTAREDAPRLVTTISGLGAGELYNVYAYFQSNISVGTNDWRVRAGLEDSVDDLPLYSRFGTDNDATAGTLITAETVPENAEWFLGGGNRGLFQALLGTATADESGEIPVYIDDFAFGTLPRRTWYDGVGYELAEPSVDNGDFNGDGNVDAADYVVWRKNNINDQQGYDDWRANFGAGSGSGAGGGISASASAAPEPSSLMLCGLLVAIAALRGVRAPVMDRAD
jgi:hypothetical protein